MYVCVCVNRRACVPPFCDLCFVTVVAIYNLTDRSTDGMLDRPINKPLKRLKKEKKKETIIYIADLAERFELIVGGRWVPTTAAVASLIR